jgi:hypothetical protein
MQITKTTTIPLHDPQASIVPPTGAPMPADFTRVPSVSFVDCLTTVDCSTITPESNVDDSHSDLPPPAEPPPQPPQCLVDTPPGSIINHIVSNIPRLLSPTTLFEFPLYNFQPLSKLNDDLQSHIPMASVF